MEKSYTNPVDCTYSKHILLEVAVILVAVAQAVSYQAACFGFETFAAVVVAS